MHLLHKSFVNQFVCLQKSDAVAAVRQSDSYTIHGHSFKCPYLQDEDDDDDDVDEYVAKATQLQEVCAYLYPPMIFIRCMSKYLGRSW
jgi:hypothetical protein